MNKNKKIAMAAVATVMAGAMVVPLAACNGDKTENLGPKVDLSEYKWDVFDADGNLNYDAYKRETPVTLNIAIGYNSDTSSTAFAKGSTYTLPDGKTYVGGAMKPAWVQMGEDLNITWNDVYNGYATSANLEKIIAGQGLATYANTDMFTTDLSAAVNKVNAGTSILNLADYLDYMPNFKNFLEENPVVYLSLLQDGMSTEDGSNQKLYVAPYFDGNDDIERYCIIRQDWASAILNGDTALATGEAFSAKCAATTSVQAFMSGLDNLAVDITDPADVSNVKTIYKNYANVLSQIKTSGSALDNAYKAIASDGYNGTSGNIIDIMNAAILANNAVTGDKLVTLFRAYVDACYTTGTGVGAASYYTAANRADLFNGYDAAWDVDDLVAMLRCVLTNQNTLLSIVGEDEDYPITNRNQRKIYGIAPRTGQNDRTPDMVRLACQLYGARGADSRYEYTYIDNAGVLQDARNDKSFYQALENMHKLAEEGLVVDYTGYSGFGNDSGYVINDNTDQTKNVETFMMYDYCQTQTLNGFYLQDATGVDVPETYNFAPILTPVSKWDVNGDETIGSDEYFRFTESWRSTKTSGLALNGSLAYNKDKLIAALQFVDYLYSEDGQIVSTYGPMATNKYGDGGFWYNETIADADLLEEIKDKDGNITQYKNYFTYKGVNYTADEPYKGNMTPSVTDMVYYSFQKGTANDKKGAPSFPSNVAKAKLSFTNYARWLIGSTLPVGVKNQSFENQLTSEMGKVGAARVGAALANGVVKGMSLQVNDDALWYTCVPTGLPIASTNVTRLNNSNMNQLKYMSGEAKTPNDKEFLSLFNVIILGGSSTGSPNFNEQGISYTFSGIDALVTYMSTDRLAAQRESILASGWKTAREYWQYLKPQNNQ